MLVNASVEAKRISVSVKRNDLKPMVGVIVRLKYFVVLNGTVISLYIMVFERIFMRPKVA